MATPKSTMKSSANGSKFLSTTVNIGAVSAASSLDVQVTSRKGFKVGRPVLVWLDPSQAALAAGIEIQSIARVIDTGGDVLKIVFRVLNLTASPVTPGNVVLNFLQL